MKNYFYLIFTMIIVTLSSYSVKTQLDLPSKEDLRYQKLFFNLKNSKTSVSKSVQSFSPMVKAPDLKFKTYKEAYDFITRNLSKSKSVKTNKVSNYGDPVLTIMSGEAPYIKWTAEPEITIDLTDISSSPDFSAVVIKYKLTFQEDGVFKNEPSNWSLVPLSTTGPATLDSPSNLDGFFQAINYTRFGDIDAIISGTITVGGNVTTYMVRFQGRYEIKSLGTINTGHGLVWVETSITHAGLVLYP